MPAPSDMTLAALDMGSTLIWSGVLIVALFALFMGVSFYRKWMNADDTPTGAGFTLSDLRQLHKQGQMTTEEFERAKANLLGSLKAAVDKPADGPTTKPTGPNPDRPDA